jgi:protein-disulfide isomerase
MEIKPEDSKHNNRSVITSLASSVFCGLICILIGFGGWYFYLRPSNEAFPFSKSWLEILIIIILMGAIGFWLGPKLEKIFSRSRYSLVIQYILTGALIFVSGVGVGYILWGRQTPQKAANTDTAAADEITIPENIKRYDVPVDDDPSLGPADAAVTIIEFSDFQCPFCTKWQVEVWPEIQKAFPDQVRLVYRDFPLYGLHDNAEAAAEAADCAGEQGAYWKYHDKLFSAENGLGAVAFKQYADELGLDSGKFSSCLESGIYKDEVKADYEYASKLGVSSTPTFFINGIPVVGAQPFSVFQQLITKELAGEIPQ